MKYTFIFILFCINFFEIRVFANSLGIGNDTSEEQTNVVDAAITTENVSKNIDGDLVDEKTDLVESNSSVTTTILKETQESLTSDFDQKWNPTQTSEVPGEDSVKKNCEGISCSQPPEAESNCESLDPSLTIMTSILSDHVHCCPFWICTRTDGSMFTYFGMSSNLPNLNYKKGSPTFPIPLSKINFASSVSNNEQKQSDFFGSSHQPFNRFTDTVTTSKLPNNYYGSRTTASEIPLSDHIQFKSYSVYSQPNRYEPTTRYEPSESTANQGQLTMSMSRSSKLPLVSSNPLGVLTQPFNPAFSEWNTNMIRGRRDSIQQNQDVITPYNYGYGLTNSNFREGIYNGFEYRPIYQVI